MVRGRLLLGRPGEPLKLFEVIVFFFPFLFLGVSRPRRVIGPKALHSPSPPLIQVMRMNKNTFSRWRGWRKRSRALFGQAWPCFLLVRTGKITIPENVTSSTKPCIWAISESPSKASCFLRPWIGGLWWSRLTTWTSNHALSTFLYLERCWRRECEWASLQVSFR